jgi:FG-GAP repeat
MLFVNRRARKSNERTSSHHYFQPLCEGLEDKVLLTTDLGNSIPGANPTIANAPFGMDFAGGTIPGASTTIASQFAGTSVADVGDLNGDGYEDFAIATPGVNNGISGTSYVSVVFGSNLAASPPTVQNWIGTTSTTPLVYTYLANDRVGDLSQLGATTQQNPALFTPTDLTFPFAGVTFYTPTLDMSGASSVAAVNIGGRQGLLIGAQNAPSPGGTLGTGRVYLIYGDFNTYNGQTINLDMPGDYPQLNFVTFNSTASGIKLGASVAGGVNILGDGSADVILGAPSATIDGQVNTGAVYVIPTTALTGLGQSPAPIDVTTVGQSGGFRGLTLAGANSGDQTGFSVADAGNVNGAASGADDLIIGAPQSGSGAGLVYLVYGGSGLPALATTTAGVTFVNLSLVGTTGTGAVPGAVFTGPAGNALTGFSVSSAGDWNGDGLADIIFGAPDFSTSNVTNEGDVFVFYGAPSTSASFLTGIISLASIPTSLPAVQLTGANAGDLAGSSVSLVGVINSGQPNEVLIGAPGFNSQAGAAYLLPGRTPGLTGTFSLSAAEGNTLAGIQYVLSTLSSPSTSPNLFGTSVSGRLQTTTHTSDLDNIGDFIIGAPGYDITQGGNSGLGVPDRPNAGGGLIVQGGLVTLRIPPPGNQVTTQIGVGQPFGPFNINSTTPANLPIYVFGSTSTTPSFMPVTDINPSTVTVNGIAFTGATLTPDPNTANWLNGIQDAIITISPRANLRLPNGVDTITISGQMVASSPLAGFIWTGTASVTVTGGPVTPVISGLAGVPTGPNLQTTFISAFGANQYTPSLTSLSAFNYQPIPVSIALQQYLVPQGFRQRIYSFNHPGKTSGPYLINRGQNKGRASGINTLSSKVYNRSRFHAQKDYAWTHKAPKVGILKGVVPIQSARQRFRDNLIH